MQQLMFPLFGFRYRSLFLAALAKENNFGMAKDGRIDLHQHNIDVLTTIVGKTPMPDFRWNRCF
jgi:hypothetical protein